MEEMEKRTERERERERNGKYRHEKHEFIGCSEFIT